MLHVLTALILAILELAPHRLKRVTHGDIGIFMGMPIGVIMLRDEMGAPGRDLNANLVDPPLLAVFVWQRDDHVTVDDFGVELDQALCKLADARA
jgi:hypothetical protein